MSIESSIEEFKLFAISWQDGLLEAIARMFQGFFEAHPEVAAVVWAQGGRPPDGEWDLWIVEPCRSRIQDRPDPSCEAYEPLTDIQMEALDLGVYLAPVRARKPLPSAFPESTHRDATAVIKAIPEQLQPLLCEHGIVQMTREGVKSITDWA